MNLIDQIQALPTIEKLKIMESIWQDLTDKTEDYDPPPWHEAVLKDTESLAKQGKLEWMNLDDVKRRLRESS